MRFQLRDFRERRGMTQKELAKVMHKAIGTIQSWECETSYPNAEALCELCSIFDTDPNTILGWYDDHPEDLPRCHAPILTADEAEVLGNYRECTPEWKRTVAMNALAAKGESLKIAESAARLDAEVSA